MRPLAGRHALVTGANRGIGAAIACRLAADGARVTLLVRRAGSADALLSSLPTGTSVIEADVMDAEQLAHACRSAESMAPVDILINNAGSAESAPFLQSNDSMFERMLAVHLHGPVRATRTLLPGMLARGHGRVVNIASTAGLTGYPYVTAYVSAKHAVVGFTRALAREVAAKGVTVNAVCPGYTDTDIVAASVERIVATTGRTPDAARAALTASTPLKRLVRPDEVAATVAWLCRDDSAAVTGQAIAVDGGELA